MHLSSDHCNRHFDVIEIVNKLLLPFGFDVNQKWTPKSKSWFRKLVPSKTFVLTTLVWADFVFGLIVSFIPTEQKILLSLFADTGYYTVGIRYRHISTSMMFFYRLHLLLMQTNYWLDSHRWLRRANQSWLRISSFRVPCKTFRTIRRLRSTIYLFTLIQTVVICGCIAAVMFSQNDLHTNFPYKTGVVYLPVVMAFNTYYSGLFFAQYYLLCKLATELFSQFIMRLRRCALIQTELSLKQDTSKPTTPTGARDLKNFFRYLYGFSHVYRVVYHFNFYLQRSYLAAMLCSFGVCVQLFYVSFYTELNWIAKSIFQVALLGLVSLGFSLSHVAGRVDHRAKTIGTILYCRFNVERKMDIKKQPRHVSELIRCLQTIDGTTVGLEILGNPINVRTSITIATAFFTILVILVHSFHF